jgi:hypothetical protein
MFYLLRKGFVDEKPDQFTGFHNRLKEKTKINSALRNNADEWKKRIMPLIERVGHNCKRRRFTNRKAAAFIFMAVFFFVVGAVLVYQLVAVLAVIGDYASYVQNDAERARYLAEQLSTYSALSVAVVAIKVSAVPVIFAFPKPTSEDFADSYYNRDLLRKGLKEETSKADRPLLKALINMKCKEPDLILSHIYHTHPELFEEKALLQKLY